MRKKIPITLFCVLLVSACANREDEARILLNQAIQDWESGKIESAVTKLDYIESNYLSTKTATEAIKEKAQRIEEYKQENDPDRNVRLNGGPFAKQVIGGH